MAVFSHYQKKKAGGIKTAIPSHKSQREMIQTWPRLAHCHHFWSPNKLTAHFPKWKWSDIVTFLKTGLSMDGFGVWRPHADQFRLAGATFNNIWGLLHFVMFVFGSSLSRSVRRRAADWCFSILEMSKREKNCFIKKQDLCIHVRTTNDIHLWLMGHPCSSYFHSPKSMFLDKMDSFCPKESTLQTTEYNFMLQEILLSLYWSYFGFRYLHQAFGNPGSVWYWGILQSRMMITFLTWDLVHFTQDAVFGIRKQI